MIICTQKVKEVNFITQRNSNLQKVSITTKLIEVNRYDIFHKATARFAKLLIKSCNTKINVLLFLKPFSL